MLPRSTLDLNLADYAQTLDATVEEAARQRAVARARAYHAGRHMVRLTDRLRSFLADVRGASDGDLLRLNVARTVVTAVTERLIVTGFPGDAPALSQWCWNVWRRNRMDVAEDDLHELVVRDGEAFLLVSWDDALGLPRLTPHPRFVDAALDADQAATGSAIRAPGDAALTLSGQGFGCRAHYPDDDLSQPIARVTKRWAETRWERGRRTVRQRLTVYHPDRVEKYLITGAGLQQVRDTPDEPWPIPWLDRAGRPLGVAAIHVRNAGLQCEAWEAIPLQNAINKLLVDLLAASDETAFRIFYALGFIPTTDGQPPRPDKSNWWKLQPGQLVGTTRGPSEAAFGAIEPADLAAIIAPLNQLILWTAMATDTPVSRFITTAQVAAEGTLKQQEGPLVNKVRKRQTLIGNGYEDAMQLGARLAGVFGRGPALPEGALIETGWAPAETRDVAAEIDAIAVKREKLGISQEQAWREAGYSEEQIAQMQAGPEYQARLALIGLGAPAPRGDDDDQ